MKIIRIVTLLLGALGYTAVAMALPPQGNEQGSSNGQPFLSLQEQIDQTYGKEDNIIWAWYRNN